MRSLFAFVKKEVTEQIRSGKLTFLCILFVLVGVMNPAVAKLTPWLLELLSESLEGSGMTVTAVDVNAMDSWMQFFKNLPIALIAFVLLESAIFTKEYALGTLVLSLTKGLSRFKVVVAKTLVLMLLWTCGYWLCFGITYGYNAYFWDNTIAQSLAFSAVCWWLFGIWVVSLTVLFSTVSVANTGVLVGVGGVAFASYLLGLLPKLSEYLPTHLTDGNALVAGLASPRDYLASLLVALASSLIFLGAGLLAFRKKKL